MMKAWHRSITAFFTFAGVAWAAWLVRVPEIKALMGVRSDQLGLILVAGGVGALFALIISTKVIERFGTRSALVWGYALFSLSIVAGAFLAANHQPIAVGALLFSGGFGIGTR
jgi:predicted MFS family arabinose efflux permease